MAIAIVRQQYVHLYGGKQLVGQVTEMSPRRGTCTFVLEASDDMLTLELAHLDSLVEIGNSETIRAAELNGVNYLDLARNRGWDRA